MLWNHMHKMSLPQYLQGKCQGQYFCFEIKTIISLIYSKKFWLSFEHILKSETAYYTSWPHLIHLHHKRKQDYLLQGQAQLNQRVIYRFVTLRLEWGSVILQKWKPWSKNAFSVISSLFNQFCFLPVGPPPITLSGGRGVVIWQKLKTLI